MVGPLGLRDVVATSTTTTACPARCRRAVAGLTDLDVSREHLDLLAAA